MKQTKTIPILFGIALLAACSAFAGDAAPFSWEHPVKPIAGTFFGLASWDAADDPSAAGMRFDTLSIAQVLWKSATTSHHLPMANETVDFVYGTYDFGEATDVANGICGGGPRDYAGSIANQVTAANSAGLVRCSALDGRGNPTQCTANMIITLGPEGANEQTWSTCCPSTAPSGACTHANPCSPQTCQAGKGCAWADYQKSWQNFIRQVSQYFDGRDRCRPYIRYYEVWTEANAPESWGLWQSDNGNLGCVRTDCGEPLPGCSDASGTLAGRMAALGQVAYCCLSGAANNFACPANAVSQWCPAKTQWGGPSHVLTPSVTGPLNRMPSTLPSCAADSWMKTYLNEAHKITTNHGALADIGSYHGYVVQPAQTNGLPPPWPDDRSQTGGDFTYKSAVDGSTQTCMVSRSGWPGNTCYGSIQDRAQAMRLAFNNDSTLASAPMFDVGSWGNGGTPPDPNAAAWLARWYVEQASLASSLNLGMAGWFAWGYDTSDEAGWGAIETSGARAPAADACNRVRDWLTEPELQRCPGAGMQPCTGPDGHDFTECVMTRPWQSRCGTGYTAKIVWSSASELGHAASVYAPDTAYTQYRNLAGDPPCPRNPGSCGWAKDADKHWIINGIGDSPILLEGCVGDPPAGYTGWTLSDGACTPMR
jgi:hypothetical protein